MGRDFFPWNDLGSRYLAATQLRICAGPWVCVDWIWKPWALHAGSSCHQRAPEANGSLLKWREMAYWSWVMGLWTPRGLQSDPLGALFIFCKLGIHVKAACRTKKGPSQNFRMLFLSFSDPFSSGVGSLMLFAALKHVLSPLRSKIGP